jgi:hypothetical protein
VKIKTSQGYQNTGTFIAQHQPLAYDASNPPNPIPPGGFPVGSDFFTVKTADELQAFIDTTYQNLAKLNFTATNVAAATAAKEFIKAATTTSSSQQTVRWGMHQHDVRPAGDVGNAKHFTMIGNPTDWHLYVVTNGSQIAYMSQSANPADLVSIKRY